MQKVSLTLDDRQYQNVLRTLDYVSNYVKFERFRGLKPTCGFDTEEKRRKWWQFAIKSFSQDFEGKAFTWDQVLDRKQKRKEYIQLYKRSKKVSWLKSLDPFEVCYILPNF
jgi:hypothetical protein